MDGYKKIIRNKHMRLLILKFLGFIPDKQMLQIQYRIKFKRKLNLKKPQRFTEKMQLYKLKYRTKEMVQCSDKYLVREYLRNKGLENILIDQYKVYATPEQINLSELPNKFVLKVSNGSGTNYICRDKSIINQEELIKLFKKYIVHAQSNPGREWPYTQANSVIVAEQLLEDPSRTDNSVTDYKIFCYNGKPEYVICISGRYTDHVNHLVYDTQWRKQHVVSEGANIEEDEPRPDNLEEMLDIARKISEGFPFARVDLYSIQGKIYFGEVTFFPWSGFMEFEPDSFDFKLGEKLIL